MAPKRTPPKRTAPKAAQFSRAEVIGHRWVAHGFGDEPGGPADPAGLAVLRTGVQDMPPGTVAQLALRVRAGASADVAGAVAAGVLGLAHSVRGATHLHRVADLGRYAAALRPDDAAELTPTGHGPFFAEIGESGLTAGDAFDRVAAAMREVMADGRARTKGELSGAVTPRVDRRLAPWCAGCGVHHVHDGLFRYATLQAGLVLMPGRPARFHGSPVTVAPVDREASRRVVLRDYLRLAGPATPQQFAAWLGLTPAGARAWWRLAPLVPVTVEGVLRFAYPDDLDGLRGASPPRGVRLLPPYDPVTEVGDRALLLPEPAHRRLVWRPSANPGVLLADGEIAGVWRQRRTGRRLTLTVTGFRTVARRAVEAEAERFAALAGDESVEVRWPEP